MHKNIDKGCSDPMRRKSTNKNRDRLMLNVEKTTSSSKLILGFSETVVPKTNSSVLGACE